MKLALRPLGLSVLQTCSLALAATSCASISAVPLNPDGTKAEKQAEGIRYYMPKPYLLVAELPLVKKAEEKRGATPKGEKSEKPAVESMDSKPDKPKEEKKPDPKNEPDEPAEKADSAMAAGSSTSFFAGTPHYVMKLVYLPDMTRPMALTASGGWFGTATVKPTLQDGWMLTNLDGSVDSKLPETITALGAALGLGAKSGGGGDGGGGAEAMFHVPYGLESAALKPGLCEFEYGDKGNLIGLKRLTEFPIP